MWALGRWYRRCAEGEAHGEKYICLEKLFELLRNARYVCDDVEHGRVAR